MAAKHLTVKLTEDTTNKIDLIRDVIFQELSLKLSRAQVVTAGINDFVNKLEEATGEKIVGA